MQTVLGIILFIGWLASVLAATQYFEHVFKPCSAWFDREYRQYGQPDLDWRVYSSMIGFIALPVMMLIVHFGGRRKVPART